ncbi:hypothetical protein NMG60_11003466 [Bertholletia excelsa]
MSRAGVKEEDDECFYESLDRILSSTSSCASSSAEDDDGKDPNSSSESPNYAPELPPLPVLRFPLGVSRNYDLWISEPSSIEARRMRLLRQMGLSRDPVLSRLKPSISSVSNDFDRSASTDHLKRIQQNGEVSSSDSEHGIVRLKLDKATDHCNSSSSTCPSQILSVDSVSLTVSETGGPFVNNHIGVQKPRNAHVLPVVSATSSNKPPAGKYLNDSTSINLSGNGNSSTFLGSCSGGELEKDSGRNDAVNGPVFTIKNLDNGKEFVVNEVREDGMWNKLKEVGTGRQLTMEEFEMCVGHSPIVQELMRRQNVEERNKDNVLRNVNGTGGNEPKLKKRGGWLKSIRNVAVSMTGQKDRRSSDERDTSSEKGGWRSSSATDDSQDVSFHGPERVRVRQYGKPCKELTSLYKCQEIQAHNGSIWSIKFSLDGKYLASAGEDCVIHIWEVQESELKGDLLIDKSDDRNLNILFLTNGSPEPTSMSPIIYDDSQKKRRGRPSISRKSLSVDHIMMPETMFTLSEKPFCSFQGHFCDVLDLSWSKSQHLLSSSMDKTVRLWHLSSKSCLKIFKHSDYVTCIQFNPVDDRYFISGSLDAKVRIWSIPNCQVVDWSDLHEMVTAACYTPDGQGALVGSHMGSCHLYNASDNKLQQKGHINLQNKQKKSHHKKITGFQFAPESSSEVLVTSADSRIRIVDGVNLVHKFKGFRNTNSQISASLTANGKYMLCASEDSHIYVWKNEGDSHPTRSKAVTVTQSYEHFHCQDVSVALAWPGTCDSWGFHDNTCSGNLNQLCDKLDEASTANHPPTPVEEIPGSPLHGIISSATNGYFFDRISATYPEENLVLATKICSPRVSLDFTDGVNRSRSAWGMVIVAATLGGQIRTYQNFGLPIRI